MRVRRYSLVASVVGVTLAALLAGSAGVARGVEYGPNVVLGCSGVAASTTFPGYPPALAVDGSEDTYWNGMDGAFPAVLACDLGAGHAVTAVRFGFMSAPGHVPRAVTFATSADGATWFERFTGEAVDTGAWQYFDVSAGLGRYVRVTVASAWGGTTACIGEWAVFEDATPSPSSSPSGSPGPSPSPGASATPTPSPEPSPSPVLLADVSVSNFTGGAASSVAQLTDLVRLLVVAVVSIGTFVTFGCGALMVLGVFRRG